MDITLIFIISASLLGIWTFYGLLFIIAMFKIVNRLKDLKDLKDSEGQKFDKYLPTYVEGGTVKEVMKGDVGDKVEMSADELAMINAKLDTEIAQKSATRKEDVVVHIADLTSEETIED